MPIFLECVSCRCTPEDKIWREHNEYFGVDVSEWPENGFDSIEDWQEYAEYEGAALDCPECGSRNEMTDMDAY